MANTDVYVNKITLPKDRSNTYTGILVDTASQKPWYGTSATTASSQIKVVSCTGFYLQTGAIISIAFTEANTYSDGILYLNVNSTGSKAVYLNGSQTAAHQDNLFWEANSTLTFVYDGAYFRFISKGVNGGSVWYGSSITTASTQAKTVEIPDYFLEKGSLVVIHFSTANTYSSAKITLDVNSTGAKDIYYNGSVTSSSNKLLWEANTTITFVYNGTGYVYVTSSKGGTVTDVQIGGTSILSSGVANIVTNTAYNSSTNKIATMSDIPSQTPTLCWYGTCSTTASTSEKAVTCSGYTLNAGNIIGVLFTTGSTAAIPSLNVNSTGAKTIYVGYSTTNSTTNTFTWSAGTMIYFMYDGSRYRYITSISDGFTSQAFGANTWYGSCSTGATTADKVVTCDNYVLTKGSLISIYFTNGNTYSGGVLRLNINLTGLYNIYYKSTRTSSSNTLFWDSGDVITFMYDGNYYRFVSRSTNTSALTIRTWS